MTTTTILAAHEVQQLAAMSYTDPRTVRKAYRMPWKCRPSTYGRIRAVAETLKLPPPPPRLCSVKVDPAAPPAKTYH